jgi:N-acetylmuramoyl-L-alanine amidase
VIATADSRLVGRLHPSPNFEPRQGGLRPTILVLHYTGMSSHTKALDWLSRPESKVSCHYVIDTGGEVTQMVAEDMRAWHAGLSHWAGESDVNSASIGIEIHNPGHEGGYPDFPGDQMRAVAAVARDICARHAIAPARVLAHSDVAPLRKIDPGEKFDWRWLAGEGVGCWVEPVPLAVGDDGLGLGAHGADVRAAQCLLAQFGYGVPQSGVLDEHTGFVVRAFQRHFRPAAISGRLDASTLRTLERLVAAVEPIGTA